MYFFGFLLLNNLHNYAHNKCHSTHTEHSSFKLQIVALNTCMACICAFTDRQVYDALHAVSPKIAYFYYFYRIDVNRLSIVYVPSSCLMRK